jgi:hypothetical protein
MTARAIPAALLALALGPAGAVADPFPQTPPRVLPDPSPKDSHAFAPSEATAGTADPGRKLAAIAAADPEGCSARNPCAMPPPPLDNAGPVLSRAPQRAHPG